SRPTPTPTPTAWPSLSTGFAACLTSATLFFLWLLLNVLKRTLYGSADNPLSLKYRFHVWLTDPCLSQCDPSPRLWYFFGRVNTQNYRAEFRVCLCEPLK